MSGGAVFQVRLAVLSRVPSGLNPPSPMAFPVGL